MPRDCTQFNVLMSTALLLVASLLIGLLQPFTKNIEFGNGKFIDTVEDALETVWILLSKGCATAVMVVWTSTLTKLELNGISSSTPSVVRTHMHIFWAIAITLSGSLLCSTLERAECWLQRQEQQQEKRLFDAVDAEKAVEGAQKSAAIHRSINRLSAYIEGSNLMQATLGWVAGVAWTDVALDMFPMLSQPPTLINLMMNIGASLVLTLLSVLYLVLTADNCRIVDLTDRAQVEKHFLVGAMSFFAGWGWVLVIRDVFYPVGAGIQGFIDVLVGHAVSARVGQLISVLIFAPSLTICFFRIKHSVVAAYQSSLGTGLRLKWNECISKAAGELDEGTRSRVRSRTRISKMRIVVQATHASCSEGGSQAGSRRLHSAHRRPPPHHGPPRNSL
uniref:Transmembrane protein n=1 Tax=Haptolina ericina TaxID=156174 RepID=A0A7S3F1A7_9EUKA